MTRFRRPVAHRFALTAVVTTLTLLSACSGGSGSGGDDGGGGDCGESARKRFVLDVARDWYLFPETLPTSVNVGAYATAEDLLDALTATARAQGKDRWFSYLTTRAEEQSLFGEGEFVGFGFRNREDAARAWILDVFAGSPAAEAGLQRGDEILAVDAGAGFVPVAQSFASGSTLSDLLGPADAGVRRGLRIARNGTTLDVAMSKRTVTIDPVPDGFGATVLPLAGTTGVGYIHLRSYISTADAQLRDAFAAFRAQGVQYFIVDVRYNGGGLLATADVLGDLLGAARSTSDVHYRIRHNAARASQDSTVRFQPRSQSVAPVRVAFLTTGSTASASELSANGLQPWVETAIVGSDTLGKPVGQYAFDLQGCQDRLRLVALRTVNAQGAGDYYDGLAGTMAFACAAEDTLDAPLGSPADSLVTEAMHWLATGACRTVMTADAASAARKSSDAAPADVRPRTSSPAEHWLPGLQ